MSQEMKQGTDSIETSKLEWGPELGQMSWGSTLIKIEEINKSLAKGETPWRLPTIDELLLEFKKNNSAPSGFDSSCIYWSGTTHPVDSGSTYMIDMGTGEVSNGNNRGYTYVHSRCVR
jgi:hypothetical protein